MGKYTDFATLVHITVLEMTFSVFQIASPQPFICGADIGPTRMSHVSRTGKQKQFQDFLCPRRQAGHPVSTVDKAAWMEKESTKTTVWAEVGPRVLNY